MHQPVGQREQRHDGPDVPDVVLGQAGFADDSAPRGALVAVRDADGTTDAAAWVPLDRLVDGSLAVSPLVHEALALR